jgi:hypothetical protein
MGFADDSVFLGGRELMLLLLLAFGGALAVGNVAALIRPPHDRQQDSGDRLERAPAARSVVMALVGGIAAVWALASLVVN